jgi:hypothetical protein
LVAGDGGSGVRGKLSLHRAILSSFPFCPRLVLPGQPLFGKDIFMGPRMFVNKSLAQMLPLPCPHTVVKAETTFTSHCGCRFRFVNTASWAAPSARGDICSEAHLLCQELLLLIGVTSTELGIPEDSCMLIHRRPSGFDGFWAILLLADSWYLSVSSTDPAGSLGLAGELAEPSHCSTFSLLVMRLITRCWIPEVLSFV